MQECFALTREHDSALNARGSLFYFYCLSLQSLHLSRRVLDSGEIFAFGARSGLYAYWVDSYKSWGLVLDSSTCPILIAYT